jgi:hypothetical protein
LDINNIWKNQNPLFWCAMKLSNFQFSEII